MTADSEPPVSSRPGRRVRIFLRDPSVRAAIFAFALTRFVILAVFVLTPRIEESAAGSFDVSRNSFVDFGKGDVTHDLRRLIMTADVNWYVGIAGKGYERLPFEATTHHNWGFFPLYPMLLRVAHAVTGEFAFTGVALSSLCFLLALIVVHKIAGDFGFDRAIADRAVFYLAAFPTSYFFSLPLTEALFLFLTATAFYSARRNSWWLAGGFGALASATRVTGVLLLPALAVLYWQMRGQSRPRLNVLSLLLIPAGLLAYMSFLYVISGNLFAATDSHAAWGRRTGVFIVPLLDYLRQPWLVAVPWDFKLLNFIAITTALGAGLVLLRRQDWALASYTLLCVGVTLSSTLLQSQARYAMVVFPVFFILGVVGKNPLVDQSIRVVFVALLALMSALFAAHFNIALS